MARTFFIGLALALACGDDSASESDDPVTENASPEEQAALIEDAFPLHGAVTGTQLRVHVSPDESSTVVGWLRVGSRVRVAEETQQGAGCRWRSVQPTGWVCADDGLEVQETEIAIEPPSDEGWKNDQTAEAAGRNTLVLPPAARDATLPYDYFYVKESTVPEYHRLPSRNEQRAALTKATRYRELYQLDEDRAARYLAGADDGPPGTAVNARYLQRGFYIASNGSELRASRRFVRTTQGRFVKRASLEERHGHEFHGVELEEGRDLPVAWTTRTSRLRILGEGDEVSWTDDEETEPWPRQTFVEGWQERRNIGGDIMHVIETEAGLRYLRAWFVSVAEKIDRPDEIAEDEPWVHVDLSEQTLVLYQGDTPVYATLVSTGVEENATPVGVFEIRRKHITDTMANIGDTADDAYRIEDVPWTQYFEGSFALHTAFWHTRFGLPRSHGCVNMTPVDAHRVFQSTWPQLPPGWHGLSTDGTEFRGSHVVVTE